MGAEALVVSALVNSFDWRDNSNGFLAVVTSAVGYAASSKRYFGLVAVVFGVGSWAIRGSSKGR